MNIVTNENWIFFSNENSKVLDIFKIGKWMVYFSESGREYITEMCEKAVSENIVPRAKIAVIGDVACFYLNIDDIEYHKKCINFMMENNLIRKTKDGRYYNISFKKDTQTLKGEYGVRYIPKLKLEDFINLYTGEWIFNDHTIEVDFYGYCKYYLSKLKTEHLSCLERIKNAPNLDETKKKERRSIEYTEYNSKIHACQICQNAYKRISAIETKKVSVRIPDGIGVPIFTTIYTNKPIKLLREYFGKKRYPKKVLATKLTRKMRKLNKTVYDISEITEIRYSVLENYTSKDSTISVLNISLIAAALKCNIEELVE